MQVYMFRCDEIIFAILRKGSHEEEEWLAEPLYETCVTAKEQESISIASHTCQKLPPSNLNRYMVGKRVSGDEPERNASLAAHIKRKEMCCMKYDYFAAGRRDALFLIRYKRSLGVWSPREHSTWLQATLSQRERIRYTFKRERNQVTYFAGLISVLKRSYKQLNAPTVTR
jgi:hypothetical protein